MKLDKISIIILLVGAIIIATLIYAISIIEKKNYNNAYTEGYLQCAKDFYQGKMKADLVKQENGEVIWQYKED